MLAQRTEFYCYFIINNYSEHTINLCVILIRKESIAVESISYVAKSIFFYFGFFNRNLDVIKKWESRNKPNMPRKKVDVYKRQVQLC